MSLSSPFIRRPIATSLLTAAVALAGFVAFPFLMFRGHGRALDWAARVADSTRQRCATISGRRPSSLMPTSLMRCGSGRLPR